MTTASVKAELVDAQSTGSLVSIHMHDGAFIEYAVIVDFPSPGARPEKVRVQPYRILSGSRFSKRGARKNLTINQIAYVTIKRDRSEFLDPE
ncbi:MAG: hypothetical protein DWP92_09745 [Armatimonadetes bacterium]|nr:MAG: hypothetical protein DWP92_09745 [Armatimonadota bacterium]